MDLLLVVLLVLAVGAVVAVALGRLGGGLAEVGPETAAPLEDGVRRAVDLDRARFRLALRGYRMDQVDDVLDAARDAIAARDEEIGRLRRLTAVDLSPDGPRPEPTGATEPAPEQRPAPARPATEES